MRCPFVRGNCNYCSALCPLERIAVVKDNEIALVLERALLVAERIAAESPFAEFPAEAGFHIIGHSGKTNSFSAADSVIE
jgi:hypothetical protein